MVRRLFLRHRVIKLMRDFMDERSKVEVETPIHQEHTRGRARLSRAGQALSGGLRFSAEPAAVEAVADGLGSINIFRLPCFRDEDPRADRRRSSPSSTGDVVREEEDFRLLTNGSSS